MVNTQHLGLSIPLFLLLMSFVCASVAQPTPSYTVGLAVWSGYPGSVAGFKQGLADNGLIEGENVTFLPGETSANKSIQKVVAERFKKAKVDLVYSLTTPGTTIFKRVMPTQTPIVFSIVTYPADSGLIESFEYSGNNLVGTSNYIPLSHYVQLLRLILPTARNVAIFHRKGEPNSKIQAANMIRLLKRAGIQAIDREPTDIQQLQEMALALVDSVDVFMTTTDTLLQSGGEKVLIEISLKHGVPILSSNKAGIEQGSSFGPVADFYTLGKMAGAKAAQILQQQIAPASLESELQNPPLLLVNRNSMRILGIELSDRAKRHTKWVE